MKTARHRKKQEMVTHILEKNQTTVTTCEGANMLDLKAGLQISNYKYQ